MNQKGFTLVELLTVVLILSILVAVALPQYTRSIERARATEAMAAVKALNDSVYAYAAERGVCPPNFQKLAVSLSGSGANTTTLTTKNFVYKLNHADEAFVPGTDCPGVTVQRTGGTRYDYVIWNPYSLGTTGQGRGSLACYSPSSTDADDPNDSQKVCESLGLSTDLKPRSTWP